MPEIIFNEIVLFEHRFWLQILGDHCRFILNALAPTENNEIDRAKELKAVFDRLLAKADQISNVEGIRSLTEEAKSQTELLRQLKLDLLRQLLIGNISIGLPPTFFNHMLNELKEYQDIIGFVNLGKIPPAMHPVHYHRLWLVDAAGHAAAIIDQLDPVEKDLIKKGAAFEQVFTDLYMKSVEIAGFLRTQLKQFPALRRLNQQVEREMLMFKEFLEQLKKARLNYWVLGVLSPLMADHMAREECYYLLKLSQVSNIKKPDCDPARPRIEA